MRPSIASLKRQAKRLVKTTGSSHAEALDLIARRHGFDNWSLLAKHGGVGMPASAPVALKKHMVQNIIALARQDDAASAEVFRKHGVQLGEPFSFADPAVLTATTEALQTPERAAFKQTVRDLSDDERIELIALMWLGRGDGDVTNWRALVKEACRLIDHGDVDYICGKGPLPKYLQAGLVKLAGQKKSLAALS